MGLFLKGEDETSFFFENLDFFHLLYLSKKSFMGVLIIMHIALVMR